MTGEAIIQIDFRLRHQIAGWLVESLFLTPYIDKNQMQDFLKIGK